MKTKSRVTLDLSPKICITYKDSVYRIAAGLTGVENDQSNALIEEYDQPKNRKKDRRYVYEQNTVMIFSGCLDYISDPSMKLDTHNVIVFNLHTNQFVPKFDMDTINIEPFMHPELLYQNRVELFCFAGVHEIEHLKPENILIQQMSDDQEVSAIKLESKAFRKRRRINLRWQKHLIGQEDQ